jgi:hypothetical protein
VSARSDYKRARLALEAARERWRRAQAELDAAMRELEAAQDEERSMAMRAEGIKP